MSTLNTPSNTDSKDSVERARLDIVASISAKFGQKKHAEARAALEYAVLATARDHGQTSKFAALTPSQQADLVRDGMEALKGVYGSNAEVIANAMAGKVLAAQANAGNPQTQATHTSPPRQNAWSAPVIHRMVDVCRNLVVEITRDDYFARGTFAAASHDFMIMASDDVVSSQKNELAARLAFLGAAIDSGVKAGALAGAQATQLKLRIEAQVFQLRPPAGLHFSEGFLRFYEHHSQTLHHETMKQVGQINRMQAVVGMDEKLQAIQPTVHAPAPRSRFQAGFDAARQLLNDTPPVRSPHIESVPAASVLQMATHEEEIDLDEVGYDGGPRPGM